MTIENKIKSLEAQIEKLENQQESSRGRLKFLCCCGKYHTIKDCVVIQTHHYIPARGCCEGDYWNEGELHIVCPKTDVRNRILFKDNYDVDWKIRQDYDYNPEKQFSRLYKDLFKEVREEHRGGAYEFKNNYYFDKNHKKFGIKIKK